MKSLLIEGWRGICHSLAMVNQYQILELIGSPDLCIYHADLPYYFSRWADPGNEPGFPQEMDVILESVPLKNAEEFDVVYRIGFPIARSTARAKKTLTFIVTELGLSRDQFAGRDDSVAQFCSGADRIVTPSNWSKLKLEEYGFPQEKVLRVPHGVNSAIFFPSAQDERHEIRGYLGLAEDHFALLNLGALSPNKGVNHLLTAFKHIHPRHPHTRLILKDTAGLYATTIKSFLEQYVQANGPLSRDVLNAIIIVPSSLSLDQMRQLYGAADAYVSPYRAEGFNLPVLEAIACGTPVIVTEGGSTDDFCDSDTSLKITSTLIPNKDRASPIPGVHLDPNLDSLIAQLENAASQGAALWPRFEAGRRKLLVSHSWAAVCRQLKSIILEE